MPVLGPGPASPSTALAVDGFATHVHHYLSDYIQLADKKAGFVFVATSVFLAYLESHDLALLWWKRPSLWLAVDWLACLTVALLLGSALFAYLTVVPRLGGGGPGFVYWESIVSHGSAAAYADRVGALDPAATTRLTLEHAYALAAVGTAKYRMLRAAMILGAAGLLCGLGLLGLAQRAGP